LLADSHVLATVRDLSARLVPPRLAARGLARTLRWTPPDATTPSLG
jgi:hypothetical protein